jgi:glycosyltransferase involved in cell wall biosynthesis
MQKIGVIGIRGYGVVYSGFETFIKWLMRKSKKRKFYYHLFCREPYQLDRFPDISYSLILVPTIENKYLETPLYSFLSTIMSIFKKIDVILYLGLVHAPFIFIQKLLGRKVVINVDGLDWQRKRWNLLGRLYLKMAERLTVLLADTIVCDSQTIFQYFKEEYHPKNIVYIPYGAGGRPRKAGEALKRFNLKPKKYIHFVGRLTPENCVEDLILAFKKLSTDFKCVIIGESVYEGNYRRDLLKLAGNDKRIVFTGFLFAKNYEEICSNSALYIETKEVGGTHPSLLEAIAFGNPIIAKDMSFHKEILGEYAWYYRSIDDLAKKIKDFLHHKTTLIKKTTLLTESIIKQYSWETVVKQYEKLFSSYTPLKTELPLL